MTGKTGAALDYGGGVTATVVVTCLIAASCGLIFGYDIGVTGGVTQMQSFLTKFFPEVVRGMRGAKRDAYCRYDNQLLTAFTSSLYIAGALSSLVASRVTRRVGRQAIMLTGGALFLAGSALNAGAVNIAMLIIGRMLLGVGVGFTTQAAPLYLAETAPARWRGAFTSAYHFFLVLGTVAATAANYFTDRIPGWGWRVSLGLAAVPAAVIVVGALFVPDTPSSLVLRGHQEKARASLQRVRGADADVDAEFKDIIRAVEQARRNDEGAFRRLRGEGYRHYLVMVVAIPTFFDLTGMIVISVFSPVLFRTVGFSSQKAILGSIILSLVNLCSVVVSSFAIDRVGRRVLFLAGGTVMMLCQVPTHAYIDRDRGVDNGGPSREAPRGGDDGSELRGGAGGADVPVHGELRHVVGTAQVGGTERDLPGGDPVGGAGPEHVHLAHALLRADAGVYLYALRHEVRNLPLLRRLGSRHDGLHRAAAAGDEGRAARGHALGVGEALVLEEVRQGPQAGHPSELSLTQPSRLVCSICVYVCVCDFFVQLKLELWVQLTCMWL
ncbi:hypothetical protein E2562_002742 [Oryza meyeriana var. granulata]|uniref:Major facilitator superfamily (MFS) profile domain-containing protein n=1 Tax=Oryza meyeriana var. granulata TaxID=110450 RepID=A0A6G1BSD9_9ORYZ|nr:hypothetical protein E2562_002742 [Oryza meyeriana var. granulata]